ncbi:MAG: hypothetical protein LBM93_02110, partial [Oscillospiraceae bacterium]|nr:hypothetical protein [Oscillospiraceae bacterium]
MKFKKLISLFCCLFIILTVIPINANTAEYPANSSNFASPMIETGILYSAGLTEDGNILFAGEDAEERQKLVDDLTEITQISTTDEGIAALKSDGTVSVIFWYSSWDEGQSEAENWSDIIQISFNNWYIVGLKSDGTVVSTKPPFLYDYGQSEVSDWEDIVQVSAESDITIGLKSDGTVVCAGKYEDNYRNEMSTWNDITQVKMNFSTIFGLKSDGSVVTIGSTGYDNVGTWRDIFSIDVNPYHVIGIKKDGSLVIDGLCRSEDTGELIKDCEVNCYEIKKWTDIVSVTSAMYCDEMHYVGLKSDGTVVLGGKDSDGACTGIENWDLTPEKETEIIFTITIKKTTPTTAKIFIERTSGEAKGAVSYVLLKGDYGDTNFADSTFDELKNHPDFVDYKISKWTRNCTFNLTYLEKNQSYTVIPFTVKRNVYYFGMGENAIFTTPDISLQTEMKKLTENSAQFRISRTGTANGALGYVLVEGDYSDINYKTLEEYTAMSDFINNRTSSWTGGVTFTKKNLESGKTYTIIPYTQKGSNYYFGLGGIIAFMTVSDQKYPQIIDESNEISDEIKNAIWSKFESEFPDSDFRNLKLVYNSDKITNKHPYYFDVYYNDLPLLG